LDFSWVLLLKGLKRLRKGMRLLMKQFENRGNRCEIWRLREKRERRQSWKTRMVRLRNDKN